MAATEKHKNHGGKRPGSGRKRGSLNKATKALKEMAVEYSEEAINTLVSVMRHAETPPAVKVAAADKLLDRAHGRPAMSVEASIKGELNPELLKRLETEMVARMAASRERQRNVLIERGIVVEG